MRDQASSVGHLHIDIVFYCSCHYHRYLSSLIGELTNEMKYEMINRFQLHANLSSGKKTEKESQCTQERRWSICSWDLSVTDLWLKWSMKDFSCLDEKWTLLSPFSDDRWPKEPLKADALLQLYYKEKNSSTNLQMPFHCSGKSVLIVRENSTVIEETAFACF